MEFIRSAGNGGCESLRNESAASRLSPAEARLGWHRRHMVLNTLYPIRAVYPTLQDLCFIHLEEYTAVKTTLQASVWKVISQRLSYVSDRSAGSRATAQWSNHGLSGNRIRAVQSQKHLISDLATLSQQLSISQHSKAVAQGTCVHLRLW